MTTNQNLRPLVPGTRKRRGAKNHLVKKRKIHKNILRIKNKKKTLMKIGTWNVRTLNNEGNLEQLIKTMRSFDIKILGVAETHWNITTDEAFEQDGYVILHSGRKDEIKRQGVAIIIEKELSKCMTTFSSISERVMSVTLQMVSGITTVIQVYAPDSTYDDDEVESFYNTLQQTIDSIPRKSTVLLMGDFNAKVGTNYTESMPDVVGKYSLGETNERGLRLLQFCSLNKYVLTNTVYNHKPNRRFTWISPDGKTKNQIDFIITSQDDKKIFKNSRSYQSADIGSDHSLVMANIQLSGKYPKKPRKKSRQFDVAKLMNDQNLAESFKITIGGAFAPLMACEDQEINQLYDSFKKEVNRVTEHIVGFKRNPKTEGLSKEVEVLCKQRREARLAYIANPENTNTRETYKSLNKIVKRDIKAFKKAKLEQRIRMLEEDFKHNNSYNLFKSVKELEGIPKKSIPTIIDKHGKKQTDINLVLRIWKEHFQVHLNKEFTHQENTLDEFEENNHGNVPPNITKEEVKESIAAMKNHKAPGADAISAEVLKAGGEAMINFLHLLFNKIWKEENPPLEWSKMIVTPVHKKGNKSDPSNYRAISLLSIPGKVFNHIVLQRIKEKSEKFTNENQYGFRPNRGTVDAIFIVRQIIEKAKERKVKINFNFIDFKSAFDTIWRKALWKMLAHIGIDRKIINILERLYENSKCAVTIDGKLTEWFSVLVGVRQGCLLSPTLFNIFLEFVIREIKSLSETFNMKDKEFSLSIKYADDTTLLTLDFEKLQVATMELQQSCLKWGMKINLDKCKVLTASNDNITIEGEHLENVDNFVYLGSSMPDTVNDVERRIGLALSAFGRLRKSVWSNRDILLRLKVRLYRALILSIATYASETWALTAATERKLLVFEMQCLRSILGVSRMSRIRNEEIRRCTGSEKTIVEVIKDKRLKWFGHVCRKPTDSWVYQAYKQDFPHPRPRGRPPKRWIDLIKDDTGLPILTAERNTQDRSRWRQRRHRCARGRHDLSN